MASISAIRQKIKSVQATTQITKAMNLVSASKLQKAKNKLQRTKPFFTETERVIANIINHSGDVGHKLLEPRGKGKAEANAKGGIAVIVITSDRGLCGGYNSNINKEVFNLIKDRDDEKLIVAGNKGKDFFLRRGRNVFRAFSGISENPIYEDGSDIGKLALDMYVLGEVKEVYLAYTKFISTITHEVKIKKILPLDTEDFKGDTEEKFSTMIYEPSEKKILDYVIPKYINTTIYGALIESSACEQGARMTSMDSATDNAYKMIDSLTLQYNRVRQGSITQEITEIVAGSAG